MSHVSAKKEYTFHSYTYFLQGSFASSKQQLYDNRSSQKQQQGERERERIKSVYMRAACRPADRLKTDVSRGRERAGRKEKVKQLKSVVHLLVRNECDTTLQWRCEMSDQLLRVLPGECLMGQFRPLCICAFVVNESKNPASGMVWITCFT